MQNKSSTSEKTSAHTPAPWFASPIQTADDGWTFATVGPFDVRGKALEHHVEDTIAEVSGVNYGHELAANARLIAAAPDLLAALKRYVGNFGDRSKVARAAIAKAEGR